MCVCVCFPKASLLDLQMAKFFHISLYGHSSVGICVGTSLLKRIPLILNWASLVVQMVKNLPAMQETWVQSLGWEDPLEKERQPTPLSLPEKSHGQRSLVGCSPWGLKESGMSERLKLTFLVTY